MSAFMIVFRTKTNVTVVLGTNDLRKVNERTMRYNVKKCKHADYKSPLNGTDIMILKVRNILFLLVSIL